jgi:hypothetical protein
MFWIHNNSLKIDVKTINNLSFQTRPDNRYKILVHYYDFSSHLFRPRRHFHLTLHNEHLSYLTMFVIFVVSALVTPYTIFSPQIKSSLYSCQIWSCHRPCFHAVAFIIKSFITLVTFSILVTNCSHNRRHNHRHYLLCCVRENQQNR